MKLKKIWKCLGVATIIPATIATSCCLSACSNKEEEKSLDNIKIVSDMKDIEVNLGQSYKSSTINVKAYDQEGKEITGLPIKIVLTDETGNKLPEWLTINSSNQICIQETSIAGSWVFHIQAIDQQSKVKSDYKSIRISIIDPQTIPDAIAIDSPDFVTVLSPTVKHTSLGLIAYKKGRISYVCNKKCKWEIINIEALDEPHYPTKFVLDEYGSAASIYAIADADYECTGRYNVTIQAKSELNQDIVTTKTILFQVASDSLYIDPSNNYSYVRDHYDPDSTWKLSQVPSNLTQIANVKPEIWGIPVTEVKSNICSLPPQQTGTIISIELPKTIIKIGKSAFYHQTELQLISMPGVKEVGANAFRDCSKARFSQSVEQPKLEKIDDYAFYGCSLIDFSVPQPLKSIGSLSFHLCGISNLVIDANLESIGLLAFGECPNLLKITILDYTPAFIDRSLYSILNPNFEILVPSDAVQTYKTAPVWEGFSGHIFGIQN